MRRGAPRLPYKDSPDDEPEPVSISAAPIRPSRATVAAHIADIVGREVNRANWWLTRAGYSDEEIADALFGNRA